MASEKLKRTTSSEEKSQVSAITVDDIKLIKEQLGNPTSATLKVIEAPMLPPGTIVVSTDLFESLKKEKETKPNNR